MSEIKFNINNLHIAKPCPVAWESMTGGDRTRHCDLCSLNVYNVSELTLTEVGRLIGNGDSRVCLRMYRRADGTVLTQDCPVGLRGYRKRAARVVGATLSAILGLFSTGFAQKDGTPTVDGASSGGKTIVKNDLAKFVLSGLVVDAAGAVIPNVVVLLYKTGEKVPVQKTTSDANGQFGFRTIPDGIYQIETLPVAGFERKVIENLHIDASKQLEIKLELSTVGSEVLVGIVGLDSAIDMTVAGPSPKVITREMLDRLPGGRPF